MCVPTWPCRRFDEAQRKWFADSISSLRRTLQEELVPPRGPNVTEDDQFIPVGKVLRQFKISSTGKDAVKRLYTSTVAGTMITPIITVPGATTQDEKDGPSSVSPALDDEVAYVPYPDEDADKAELFWRAVVGEDTGGRDPKNARADILAVLIFSNVTIDSEAWHVFFHRTNARDEQFCDEKLPFDSRKDVKAIFGHDLASSTLIYHQQYIVCARVINGKVITIGKEAKLLRMPYVRQERISPRGGNGRSQVYIVELAEGHYFGRSNSGLLARKDVDPRTSDTLILCQLWKNAVISRNIVEVQAIIHFPDKTSILMELAEGDLRELLRSDDHHQDLSMFKDKTRMFRKILGVGKGLTLLHEQIQCPESGRKMFGVHIDFRPQNILLVKDSEDDLIFKIADFGISFLGRGSAEDASFDNPQQGGDSHCWPPEGLPDIQCGGNRPKVNCAYDVWSFGAVTCIYLAWLWGGSKEYKNFTDKRANTPFPESGLKGNDWFFTVEKFVRAAAWIGDSKKLRLRLKTRGQPADVAIRLNEGVVTYFKNIRDGVDRRTRERKFIWDVFSILRKHCLVPDPSKRSPMSEVCKLLDDVVTDHEQLSSR